MKFKKSLSDDSMLYQYYLLGDCVVDMVDNFVSDIVGAILSRMISDGVSVNKLWVFGYSSVLIDEIIMV